MDFDEIRQKSIEDNRKRGGKKAAAKNLQNHGADFYAKIGRKGGKNGNTGGFHLKPELAKIAGKHGGSKSKRNYKFLNEVNGVKYYKNLTTGEVEMFEGNS